MPIQIVKCVECGQVRPITRKKITPANYSFWCEKCRKEVAQDLYFRKEQDK